MADTDAFWIRVGNRPLSSIGAWGDPVVTHQWPGGSWALTWSMNQPTQYVELIRGAAVTAYVGPSPVWRGYLAEPDSASGQYVAQGLYRQAETAMALDSTGAATFAPATAITQAYTRGALTWTVDQSVSTVRTSAWNAGEATDLNTVDDLLSRWTEEAGTRVWVDTNAIARVDADPTTPTWYVTPNAGTLGVADDEYVSHLYARYQLDISGVPNYHTVVAADTTQGVGRVEKAIDLTQYGSITTTQAQALVDAILAQGKASTGWSNGLEVTYGQVTNAAGSPVALSEVRAGQMVQVAGLPDVRGVTLATNVVLGETVWNVQEGTLMLNPVGLVARDLTRVLRQSALGRPVVRR